MKMTMLVLFVLVVAVVVALGVADVATAEPFCDDRYERYCRI